MFQNQPQSTGLPAGDIDRTGVLDDGRLAVAAMALPAWLIADAALPSTAALIVFFMLYCGVAAVVLLGAASAGVLHQFGWANRITWVRTALTVIIAAALVNAGDANPMNWWAVSGLTATALLLDGLDGRIARRLGQTSRFGALFDQEIDAGLILVLCLLLGLSGKVGPWIIALGAMRYVFLAAGQIFPALSRPLPPRFLRSAVCAIQVAALLVCLLPLVTPPTATVIAGIALCVLALSFGRDVLWLLHQSQPEKPS